MQLLKPIEAFSLVLILLIHVNLALSLNDTAFTQHHSRDVASANAISNDFNSCSDVEQSVISDGFWIAISAVRTHNFQMINISVLLPSSLLQSTNKSNSLSQDSSGGQIFDLIISFATSLIVNPDRQIV